MKVNYPHPYQKVNDQITHKGNFPSVLFKIERT